MYNDPAVICQWGFMASMFLKGLVAEAKHYIDVVYTQNDLKTLPEFHAMPTMFFPDATAMRNVFLDSGRHLPGKWRYCSRSQDFETEPDYLRQNTVFIMRGQNTGIFGEKMKIKTGWKRAAKGTKLIEQGVHLGEQALVFDDIAKIAGEEGSTEILHASWIRR